jgi:hypothetical protein
MKKNLLLTAGILLMITLVSCEQECLDCPECLECELEHLGLNSEWGDKVKAELTSLFFDIEDLALVRVFNTSGTSFTGRVLTQATLWKIPDKYR